MAPGSLLEGTTTTHHDLTAHEVLLLLETDRHQGLTDAEAARRLDSFGPNQLPEPRTAGPVLRFVRQLHSPLVYVLIVSGAVTVLLGQYVDASVIFAVVLVNAVVGFLQESKAEAALDSLRAMVHTEALVVREGHRQRVTSERLVPGDLTLVEAGDRVPADLRLIEEAELEVDESALTGESLPVAKDEVVLEPETAVADRRNMLYAGTLVTSGTGTGVVVATGGDTELGEIHRLVGSAATLATPLTRKLATFSGWLTVVILGLAAVTFAVGVARGEAAADMFTAAVALAVGAIPEGLPAAVTITLAIGVGRMARRRAVIRRLPAVETLGGATVICSDKTGTLTENRMTVRELWTPTQEVVLPEYGAAGPPVHRPDEALRWCLTIGANCNDARLTEGGAGLGDPTETAMLVAASRFGITPHGLVRVDAAPFTSERQYMATVQRVPGGGEALLVKGAVERVLELCSATLDADGVPQPIDRERVHAEADRLAGSGMRVLATAVAADPPAGVLRRLGEGRDGGPVPGLALAGLQAMLDPPRATAGEAVRRCRAAGLEVKMITGDHAVTAEAIARRIGLLDDREPGAGAVLVGSELEAMGEEDLPAAVERAAVFARVSPAQKLRLVEALQARHHVVAMTGDGVNDAPALKQADIGVAMGRGGTEAAKDAGDMVLLDDDFATIEAAVEEGRGVFDNLVKFIVWTLPTNMAEGLVLLVAILQGAVLPILPTQILWINMTTAVALGLMLAWEPKEPGIMERPPRDPRRSLLTAPVVVRTLLVSALLVIGTRLLFDYEIGIGTPVESARTVAVNLFVTVEAFYLFSCRSLTGPSWRAGVFSNRWLLVGVATQAVGQLALTYLPAMNALFHTAPIGWEAWLRILLVATLASLVVAMDKRRLRDRQL
ncbi:HAD family hydrolase [Nocardioides sp. GY 10113]|uniref:HAD-IC family P-type ATPase n=1 Tax=Nocardioides sp. GY 10113 TaxID=2569761 RepID=UPI0010A81A1C|nr:HAD-IC family P-type ATPase [Nocardioides sp. GY 10113]TIC87887.1 HAD family hydrolase [Nocardioides sp. GY 10113]